MDPRRGDMADHYNVQQVSKESTCTRKKRPKRRKRTVITPDEIEKLEGHFALNQRPNRYTKMELARDMGKPETFINIWFQNRRARERKLIGGSLSAHDHGAEIDNGVDGGDITLTSAAINAREALVGNLGFTPPDYKGSNSSDLGGFFCRMVSMAAAAEGGVLPADGAALPAARQDVCNGVKLRDGRLFYSNDFGFEINELDLRS